MEREKQSKHAQVASLIKKELQKRYPLVEWRVKSSSFAGGDSVDVNYTDGPTSHDVQSICDKYVNSSFDAMTDCSNYEKPSYGGEGVRFASANRHYSKQAEDASRARLVSLYHLEGLGDNDAIPDNWRVGRYYCLAQLIGHELQDVDLYPKGPQDPAPNPDRRAEISAIVDDLAQPEPTQAQQALENMKHDETLRTGIVAIIHEDGAATFDDGSRLTWQQIEAEDKQDRNIQAMLSNLRTDIAEIVSETAIVQKDALVGELMAKVDEVVLSAKTGKFPA